MSPALGQPATSPYRPDIDGLRAIAVMAVVLCHFGVPGFAGGFVGVDVFFVISGFLITGVIQSGLARGEFSILQFYERRIRRIFPAFFLVLTASTVVSYFLLLPNDLIQFGKSLGAATLFLSNIHFWRSVDYFNGGTSQPLLHTWSLGVEEQFYLVFPVLLWMFGRRSQTIIAVVFMVLIIISLALSQWASDRHVNAAFYLLPSRLWELLAGGLVTLLPLNPQRSVSNGLGVAGLILIGAAVALFVSKTRFPGLTATVPCLGACLIIVSGRNAGSLTANLLGRRPVASIGIISYSIYLWHWPVLILGGYLAVPDLSLWQKVGLLALSLVLAFLSWRFVETPFRKDLLSRRGVFRLALAATALFLAVSGVLVLNKGFPRRFPSNVTKILPTDARRRPLGCPGQFKVPSEVGTLCPLGSEGGDAKFMVWGDSHADMLGPTFQMLALEGHPGLLASYPACSPLLAVQRADMPNCGSFNNQQARLARQPNFEVVFLVSRWAITAEGQPYGQEKGRGVVLERSGLIKVPKDNHAAFAAGLERTVRTIRAAGKEVVFVHSVPEVSVFVPDSLAKLRLLHRSIDFAPSHAEYLERQAFVIATSRDLQARYGMIIVYPDQALCRSGKCLVDLNGVPIYTDNSHLNAAGAALLAPLLRTAFAEASTRRGARPLDGARAP